MTLFKRATFIQSLLPALILALISGGLFAFLAATSSFALPFALGVMLGGLLVPQLMRSSGATVATTTLYVGNLPYRANEAVVRTLFEQYGQVLSVRLMKDRQTGKRRGFGFVEMPSEAASAARTALNDTEFQQRTLKVREANERTDAESGGNDAA